VILAWSWAFGNTEIYTGMFIEKHIPSHGNSLAHRRDIGVILGFWEHWDLHRYVYWKAYPHWDLHRYVYWKAYPHWDLHRYVYWKAYPRV
jgi:hypothetical protein